MLLVLLRFVVMNVLLASCVPLVLLGVVVTVVLLVPLVLRLL